MTTTPSTTPTQASVTANAESALSVLTSAVDSLKQELDATMARKDELLERRIKAYASPLTPADIRQFVGELIDHRASFYAQQLHNFKLSEKLALPRRDGTPTHLRYPLTVEDAEYALSHRLAVTRRPDPLMDEGWTLPIFMHHGEFSSWPYFFFGSVIKEKLCAELLKMQGDSESDAVDALSMDALREEIAAITEEIARLDSNAARLRGEIGRLTRPVLTSAKRLQGEA